MKKNDCTYFRGLMMGVLYNDDQLAEKDKRAFRGHLTACPGCALEYKEMAAVLKVMAQRRRPEMGDAYWDSYLPRLREKMAIREKQTIKKILSFIKSAVGVPGFLGEIFQKKPLAAGGKIRRWVLYPAAALVLIAVGIAIGRHLYLSPGRGEFSGTVFPAQRRVNPAVSEHFENVRPLLIDYANTTKAAGGSSEEGWVVVDQKILKQLVFQNYLLKKIVTRENDAPLKQLLADLEMVLLEISNSRGGETARLVREILKNTDILFKMNVYNTNRRKTSMSI